MGARVRRRRVSKGERVVRRVRVWISFTIDVIRC